MKINSQVLHTKIPSHALLSRLTDLVMRVILSQSPNTSCATLQTPQSTLCIDSRDALHHPYCTHPLTLIVMIHYHCFRRISLLPKRGYY